MEAARLTATIDADSKDAEAGMKSFGGELGKTAGIFKTVLASAAGFALGGGIIAGIQGITSQIGDLIHAGEDANSVQAQTVAGLKSTSDASGMTAQNVSDLADKISGMTGITANSVQTGENMLLTFTNIGKNVFPQATQAVADMATKMNGGLIPSAQQLQQTSIMVGKALGDPTKGYAQLQRVGVTFTAQQVEQIKQMQKAGDMAGAQKVILGELNKEFGGSAEAAGKANGGIAILNAQFENSKEKIGQALIPVLGQLMTAVTPIISQLGDDLPGVLSVVTDLVTNLVGPAISDLGGFVTTEVLPAFTQLVAFVQTSVLPILTKLGGFVTTSILPALTKFADWAEKVVLPALDQLGKFIIATVLPALMQLAAFFVEHVLPVLQVVVGVLLTDVLPALEGVATSVIQHLVPALENLWEKIAPILIPALQFVGAILKDVVGPAISFAVGLLSGLINIVAGVIGGVEGLISWFGSLGSTIGGGVTDAFNGLGNLVSAVWTGITGTVKGAVNTVIGFINGFIDFLDGIKIKVPEIGIGPVHTPGGTISLPHIPDIPYLAGGGDVTLSGLFVGAEKGPELITKPGLYAAPPGSHVYPADQTQKLLASGALNRPPVTNTYNIYPAKAQFGPDELDTLQRRNAFLSHTGGGY